MDFVTCRGVLFLKKLAKLRKASAKELSTNLGYLGFIVRVTHGTEKSLIRIQNGIVLLSQDDTNVYYSDENRELERWLLHSGKSYLNSDLFKIVDSKIPSNPLNQSELMK
jgi:hypothetical protein